MGSDLGGTASARHRGRDDSGVVIVLVAAVIGALLVMAALVVDLAGARRDRDADQLAADAMALAGAQGMRGSVTNYGTAACQAAWSYMVVNLPSVETAPTPSCTPFATACVAATARQVQATVGPYRVTITHPVPNDSPLLQGRAVSSLDGIPCQRVGIRVQQDRANLLASGSVALDVTAVSRLLPGVGDADAPLVLLAEHQCEVLNVVGTSSLTVTTSTGAPGYIAVDSDGQDCTNPNKVVVDVEGKGTITAGQIALWALATNPNSAYSSARLNPTPTASSAPVGRTGMDWRYNCSPSNGCPTGDPAYIDDMVALWGGSGAPLPTPSSFTTWTVSGRSCSPTGDTVVPAGSWYIDCPSGLSTNGSITFQGGDIVSDGPITATGPGGLRVNCADSDINDLVAPATCATNPAAPSILYLRSGDLVDNGDLELRETTVYLATGKVTFSGNRSLTWTAPNDASFKFDDLLVWTTTTSQVKIAGNTTMTLEGIVFAPSATVELSGTTGGSALGSQIFAKSAVLTGNATLRLAPRSDRILEVGKGRAVLIR